MFVFIVYPKMDNHLYTYWLFVPNVLQNVSIYARRRLLEENQEIDSLFLFIIFRGNSIKQIKQKSSSNELLLKF